LKGRGQIGALLHRAVDSKSASDCPGESRRAAKYKNQ